MTSARGKHSTDNGQDKAAGRDKKAGRKEEPKRVPTLSADEAADRSRFLLARLLPEHITGFLVGPAGLPADLADPLIERITVAEELISWARSLQLADIAALGDLAPFDAHSPSGTSDMSGVSADLTVLDQAEMRLASALVLSRRQASRRLDDAISLRTLPRVMALLRSGLIDLNRAETISRAMNEYLQPSGDPAEDKTRRNLVEEKVTSRAHSRTAAMLRNDVGRAALTVDPDAAERRRVKAREDREVRLYRRPDGMASLEGLLDAESAAIIDNTLTLLADAQRDMAARAGMPDERTHAQRRADALTGVFRAIADGRQLRMYPLSRPGDTRCTATGAAEPGFSQTGFSQPGSGQPGFSQPDLRQTDSCQPGFGESGFSEPGFSEDSQYIPESFVRPGGLSDADASADPFATAGGDAGTPCDWETGSTSTLAAVPAWWEPPHLPRQQRRHPHLVVTVHAETLAGRDDLPGELAGYGAISAQAARDLAKQCRTADLVVLDPPQGSSPDCTPACRPALRPSRAGDLHDPHPNDPAHPPDPGPPDAGSHVPRARKPVAYKPREQVIRDVIARNRTCRAPGCTRPAQQCDLDHVIPFSSEKRSCACNLVPVCRRHLRLKTLGGWTTTLHPAAPGQSAGTLEWTSPTGLRYLVDPPDQPGTAGW